MLSLIATLAAAEPAETAPVRLSLTLVDAPFVLESGGGAFPSMAQSLDLVYGIDRLFTYGVQSGFTALKAPDPLRRALEPPLVVLFSMATPGIGFLHEEWHRAVLTHREVESVNGVVRQPPDAEVGDTVSVWGITDADLVRLKRDHPADLVRAHAAGFEGHTARTERVARTSFLAPDPIDGGPFFADDGMTTFLWWTEINTVAYLALCTTDEAERLVAEGEPLETDELARDFTGPDCNGWVYDLFRPREPYAARGPNPSGQGISRYVAPSELTPEELRYLRLQTALRLVGLANPHLFFVDGLELGGQRYEAHLTHVLAPWGFRIDVHGGWLAPNGRAVLLTLQNGETGGGWAPGLEAEVVGLRRGRLELDALAGGWLQPRELLRDEPLRPGGRAGAGLTLWASDGFGVRLGGEAKSTGFVLGETWLTPVARGTLGLIVRLPGWG